MPYKRMRYILFKKKPAKTGRSAFFTFAIDAVLRRSAQDKEITCGVFCGAALCGVSF